jgi:hypothetical protein
MDEVLRAISEFASMKRAGKALTEDEVLLYHELCKRARLHAALINAAFEGMVPNGIDGVTGDCSENSK